jgi:hypothetical protein
MQQFDEMESLASRVHQRAALERKGERQMLV